MPRDVMCSHDDVPELYLLSVMEHMIDLGRRIVATLSAATAVTGNRGRRSGCRQSWRHKGNHACRGTVSASSTIRNYLRVTVHGHEPGSRVLLQPRSTSCLINMPVIDQDDLDIGKL